MSDDRDPGSWPGRLFGWSLLLLLAAMALQGAVHVLEAIWVPLTITVALAGVVTVGVWWLIRRRY